MLAGIIRHIFDCYYKCIIFIWELFQRCFRDVTSTQNKKPSYVFLSGASFNGFPQPTVSCSDELEYRLQGTDSRPSSVPDFSLNYCKYTQTHSKTSGKVFPEGDTC